MMTGNFQVLDVMSKDWLQAPNVPTSTQEHRPDLIGWIRGSSPRMTRIGLKLSYAYGA